MDHRDACIHAEYINLMLHGRYSAAPAQRGLNGWTVRVTEYDRDDAAFDLDTGNAILEWLTDRQLEANASEGA